MQKFTQKYVIAHFIDDVPDGLEFSIVDWPLHVTLADVFSIKGSPEDLTARLNEKLHHYPILQSTVIRDELFGENNDIPVRIVDRTKDLLALHYVIVTVLEECGVQFNSPEFAYEGFGPHVTIQKDTQLEIGDAVKFDSIALVDMFPGQNERQRKILGTVSFV